MIATVTLNSRDDVVPWKTNSEKNIISIVGLQFRTSGRRRPSRKIFAAKAGRDGRLPIKVAVVADAFSRAKFLDSVFAFAFSFSL